MITEQRALILCDNSDLSDIIRETLETWRQEEEKRQEKEIKLSVTLVSSIEEGRQKLDSDNPFNFVITRLEMPPTQDKSPTSDHLGLKFIQEARKSGIEFASCVLTEFADIKLLSLIHEIPYCELVPIQGGNIQTILKSGLNKVYNNIIVEQQPSYFWQLLRKVNTIDEWQFLAILVQLIKKIIPYPLPTLIRREVDRIADIIITFTKETQRYKIIYYEDSEEKTSSFPELLKVVLPWSDLHEQMKEALKNRSIIALKRVGKMLLDELRKDYKFMEEFQRAIGFAGIKPSKLRIRFVVDQDIFPIALEALYNDEWEWWMLRAPITRCLGIRTWGKPLFWDAESLKYPINLLVIESDTTGFINEFGLNDHLNDLTHIHEECDFIAKLISDNVNVVRISANDSLKAEKTPFSSRIEQLLTGFDGESFQFDIIHFSGHLVTDGKNSYLVVPGSMGKSDPKLINVKEFAMWLESASTRLVYLNSCDSATETVIYELALCGVPAIVGFRWEVNDEAAAAFAKAFYEYLLCKNRSLEQAIVHARKQTKFKYEDDPAWASSILVLQTEDRGDCSSLSNHLLNC
jgi:hypothetical protein